jgi:WhiB family redox-sensing transcriptional regulator
MNWADRAACKGLTELFFPEHGEPADEARKVCQTCPVQAECLEAGMWEQHGVWGGTNYRDRLKIRKGRTKPRDPTFEHGTPGGYRQHRIRGEQACRICTEANTAAVLERRRRMAS